MYPTLESGNYKNTFHMGLFTEKAGLVVMAHAFRKKKKVLISQAQQH